MTQMTGSIKTFLNHYYKRGLFLSLFFGIALFNISHFAAADENIEVRAQVGSIIAGPSSEDTSDSNDGDKNSRDTQKRKSDFTTTSNPNFSVWPASFNGAVFIMKDSGPQFTTPRPAFEGKTNIQNAIITLVFEYSGLSLRSTTQADASGDWRWASPTDFPDGNFQLNITAVHPQENFLRAEAKLSFDVVGTRKGTTWNMPLEENGSKQPADLLVKIQEQYLKVAPGENIIASIRLLNFDTSLKTVDVTVEYSIQDESGKEIFNQKETLGISKELTYVKAFYTQPEMPEGTYRLVVKIPSGNTLVIASDEFIIQGKGELFITPVSKIDYSLILKGVGITLVSFLFLSYFEFIRFLQIRKHIHLVTDKVLKKFF